MFLSFLFTRKSLPVPTRWCWLLIVSTGFAFALTLLFTLEPFLTPSKPSGAATLVVEGWLPDYALDSAAALFKRVSYQRIVTTGGILEQGSYLKEYKTYAHLCATTLRAIGIPDSIIVEIPAPPSHKDRTWVSALAFASWARTQHIRSIDVCSLGAHGRRTRYLFQKAVGDSIPVGIIALPDAGYDPKKWWNSSQGFRLVIGELIAYLYVRTFFSP